MGRILKLLTTALESCKGEFEARCRRAIADLLFAESDMSSLGDVKDLSSTAAVMLKTSIFAAWAQFQTASVTQPYLDEVIRPHLPLLCPFWVASLREYARVRTDPDAASSDSGAGGAAFDSVYSGLSRETALPVSWSVRMPSQTSLISLFHSSTSARGLRCSTPSVPSSRPTTPTCSAP
jgi:HEAT repeat-containing protein 5